MSNQSRSGTIALIIGAVSSTLFLCCGPSLARSAAAQIASGRLQNFQKAQAELKKRIAADWLAVIAADKAEVASLNAATAAAMKAGNPDAVVSAQGLLKIVQARLVSEKAEPPFPPYFQAIASTAGLNDPALKIEAARNEAVAAAVAQTHLAQAAFHDAVVAADQNAIAQWKKRVNADMKADKPHAVVADMSAMKLSQQQLQQDSMTAPAIFPNRGMANQVQPVYTPPAMLPSAGMLNPTIPVYRPPGIFPGAEQPMQGNTASGQSTSIGNGISSDQWPKLVKHAMRPVEWNSVPALAAELSRYQTGPGKIIGKRVTAFLKTNASGQLAIADSTTASAHFPRQLRLQGLRLRKQIIQHFKLIRKEARLRKGAEYQWQLDLLKSQNPRAMGWQVNQSLIFGEKRECSAVTAAAYKLQRKDLRLIALAFHDSPPAGAKLVAPVDGHRPRAGAVYGVVVGISSRSIARETPQLSLPSGQQLRSQVYFLPLPNPYPPEVPPGFLVNVPAVSIPAEPIPPCTACTVNILYCARAPHYFQKRKRAALLPIKSYVFKMKSGTKMDATTYTTGDFYYHLKWNGIDLPVAKDLVVKIIPVR